MSFDGQGSSQPTPPLFPQLSHNPPSSPAPASGTEGTRGDEEGLATPRPFDRPTSPFMAQNGSKCAVYQKVGEEGICKMHKFNLWETATRYYLVGGDLMDRRFRILKIDRTSEPGDLSIAEDDIVYTQKEMSQLLNAIDDGNRSTGGLKFKCSTWGLLGFIRFTGAYYMLVITKRSQVAMIGGHYIYQVDGTDLIPLTTPASHRFWPDLKHAEEARFLGILSNLDLSRSFYFSYSYDITRTLQHNISRGRQALSEGCLPNSEHDYNAMFVWNHYLLQPAVSALKNTYDWCFPIVHGFVDQAVLTVYGRTVYITIIARRSRFFAGARFLKRGANDLGYVANDVETEQIVSEMLTTSFHAPGNNLYANPNYTSYVQHRGSIPLYWTQDNTGVTPKPPIELHLVDPFYVAAALHLDNLFERYGAPIYVLNLIKQRERTPRESKLLAEYTNAINYLNQFLPKGKKIIYEAWDMSRASHRGNSSDQSVIARLEVIAENVVTTTGFFRNGDERSNKWTMQNGVARTNCIDCLDRTNAAQFVIGKRALGHQLHALGVISDTSIEYDTDAVNLFTHMFHDHGDTIAVQYGGSHLVNTMETYRKINQWTSHSRDMVESFKRYYNNSFLDGQRQEAYNLFLGNYIFSQNQPMLWDLATDYYLHHADPRTYSQKARRSYSSWFTPSFLEPRILPPITPLSPPKPISYIDDYYLEYYRPLAVSSFLKIFSFKMNSTLKYMPFRATREGRYDLSPFRVRDGTEQALPPRQSSKKAVPPTVESPDDDSDGTSSVVSHVAAKRSSIQRWLAPHLGERTPSYRSTVREVPFRTVDLAALARAETVKSLDLGVILEQAVSSALNPNISRREVEAYEEYASFPLNIPLVVSADTPLNTMPEFEAYVKSGVETVKSSIARQKSSEDFSDFLGVSDDPLTVTEADRGRFKYEVYGNWLNGGIL
ncbi:MAG: phosphatidylinositol-3,5-bisphosphate 5-phosphatase [Trizodia sp. TS-e1964]|nr:MAG: phosphatidylinositol-3,5-bisphosphate 5-phosphatase [Trizodia sp. TS-e1964]